VSGEPVALCAGGPLTGRLRAPGDKSISHRALLVAARASGVSVLRGLSDGDDVARTAHAVSRLGAQLEVVGGAGPAAEVRVDGGADRLREPQDVIDAGNSGTGIRLLAGYVAAFDWLTVLTGDASIRRRPMLRIVEPLREMGAEIDGRDGGRLAPLVVRGGQLRGIDYRLPVPSAQVKSAVLLAALGAAGPTSVHEAVATRAHTEELLALAGGDVEILRQEGGHGAVVHLRPGELTPFELEVPADPSQAAFFIVAACLVPGSKVVCEGVYVGQARAGYLDVLERMGARIERRHRDATTADIVASYGPLVATEVGGAEVPALIDEVPVLAVAAALAEGTTTFRDVGELRVKESDRLATVAGLIGALGGRVETTRDSLSVTGSTFAGGLRVDAGGDHRVAMSAAVAALTCSEPVEIGGWDSVATSYPRFLDDLAALQ
jgi:3-phosphoshikimate 1-carboxyvinyltransferase